MPQLVLHIVESVMPRHFEIGQEDIDTWMILWLGT